MTKQERQWIEIRKLRDALLKQSDWIVIKSLEDGVSIPGNWKTYREALRNIPQNYKIPEEVIFPEI